MLFPLALPGKTLQPTGLPPAEWVGGPDIQSR